MPRHHKSYGSENSDKVRIRVLEVFHWFMKSDRELRSRAAIAKRLDVSPSRINDWEYQRGYPSIEVLVDICKEFSVAPDYLFLGKGPMFGYAEIITRIEALEKRMEELERVSGVVSANGKSKRKLPI